MRYPITPDYMAAAGEFLTPLYQNLEDYIIQKICEQFKTGEANATAIELIRQLQRRGLKLDEIEKRIKKTLKISQTQLDKIFGDAIARNQAYYGDVFDKLGLVGEDEVLSDMFSEAMSIARQTESQFFNLTRSMGFAVRGLDGTVQFQPIAQAYQTVLDSAEVKILSGAESYDVAIRQAVKDLSDSGIQVVDYASGHHDRIDVAARRAIMTGVTQISAKHSDIAAEEAKTQYREVSAHRGARDNGLAWQNHKSWQGKVYSVQVGDKYPSIYAVCGLGEVDGLCGANCRHIYYPFWDGISERTYTDEELAKIDPPPIEYQGKKYSFYQATQQQRKIERALRAVKRRMVGDESAGQSEAYKADAAKYRRLNEEYDNFTKAAGLRSQKERSYIPEFGPKEAKEALKVAGGEKKTASSKTSAAMPSAAKSEVVVTNTPKKPTKAVFGYNDVTQEWVNNATPNSHTVKELNEFVQDGVRYKVDGKDVKFIYDKHEREVAELLERKYGGEIYLMPEVSGSISNVHTPDYLFRGERLDLKTLIKGTSKNAIYSRLNESQKQADNFIIDLTNSPLGKNEVIRQAKEVFDSYNARGVKRVFLLDEDDIFMVLERKK